MTRPLFFTIPVALLMLVAMLGNWGTHYDARPSYPPHMSTLAWWVTLGLVPQLSFWIWYTIGFGAPFGIVAAAIARRRETSAQVLPSGTYANGKLSRPSPGCSLSTPDNTDPSVTTRARTSTSGKQ